MSAFLARRQYNTPILYIGVQRIACTDIEAAPKWPRKNDLSLRGDFGLHGKTILPSCGRFRNSSSSMFLPKILRGPWLMVVPPNRTAVAEEIQLSTGAATLLRIFKHATSPTVTMEHEPKYIRDEAEKFLARSTTARSPQRKTSFSLSLLKTCTSLFSNLKEVALNHGARETAQGSLRHANPQVLLDRYARSVTDEMVAAQGRFLEECGMGVERKLQPQPATDRIQNAGA